MSQITEKISIIGAGAWGIALAQHLHRYNKLHYLFSRHKETLADITQKGYVSRLTGVILDQSLPTTTDIVEAVATNILIIASNMNDLNQHLQILKPVYKKQFLVICTKGINRAGILPYQIVAHEIPKSNYPTNRIMVLSGPSFAADLSAGRLVALTLASSNVNSTNYITNQLYNTFLKVYTSNDIKGIALCGALKNILAIGNGIVRAMKVGKSGESTLISKGMHELTLLVTKLGGKKESCYGLSGLGDVLLSCNNETSRNMKLGLLMGKGLSLQQAQNNITTTVEGYHTAQIIPKFCQQHKISLPIMETVYRVLCQQLSIKQAIANLFE